MPAAASAWNPSASPYRAPPLPRSFWPPSTTSTPTLAFAAFSSSTRCPKQIDERACFDRIALDKDVDGVTAHGFGRMAMDEPAYGSATPAGIMRLLRRYEIPLVGREAVVVGRSPILGRPMAMMLLAANATVTICHSRTKNLSDVVGRAEIVVGAVGKPEFIRGSWIRDGAVVVDAGYHPGGVGDIELSAVIERCSAYTPVPGGVGPMTIATLIAHTVEAAEKAADKERPRAHIGCDPDSPVPGPCYFEVHTSLAYTPRRIPTLGAGSMPNSW